MEKFEKSESDTDTEAEAKGGAASVNSVFKGYRFEPTNRNAIFLQKVADIFQDKVVDAPIDKDYGELDSEEEAELNDVQDKIRKLFASRNRTSTETQKEKSDLVTKSTEEEVALKTKQSGDQSAVELKNEESKPILEKDSEVEEWSLSSDLRMPRKKSPNVVSEETAQPVLQNFATVAEEILHHDSETNLSILEKRFPSASDGKEKNDFDATDILVEISFDGSDVSKIKLRTDPNIDFSPKENVDCTIDETFMTASEGNSSMPNADASSTSTLSCTSMNSMGSDDIRRELTVFGQNDVGPILPSTKKLLLIRLKKLRLGMVETPKSGLAESKEGTLKTLEEGFRLDNEMSENFFGLSAETKYKRGGITRSSFNYLMLDPRITRNLPLNYPTMDEQEAWKRFVESIFYVGKGSSSRPFDHLYDAVKKFGRPNDRSKRLSAKTRKILDIWHSDNGIIILPVFHGSISDEALTREAAMIEAIGLEKLTNEKPGSYYGPILSWSRDKRLSYGYALLYRAFKIFLFEGERQHKPVDLQVKRK